MSLIFSKTIVRVNMYIILFIKLFRFTASFGKCVALNILTLQITLSDPQVVTEG